MQAQVLALFMVESTSLIPLKPKDIVQILDPIKPGYYM